MTWFFTIQTRIVCTSTLFLLLYKGLESCLTNMHGLFFGKVVKSWVSVVVENSCVVNVTKFFCVVDVGS
jgi:hypothetical protein